MLTEQNKKDFLAIMRYYDLQMLKAQELDSSTSSFAGPREWKMVFSVRDRNKIFSETPFMMTSPICSIRISDSDQ